ncbi:histidine kinase [Spirosoma sp. SC4-14]|uniref:histidine kinase n=1 Tax=Spirosoma sp. SC4-14 TaxID=3128900 RepID=UPI0030D20317
MKGELEAERIINEFAMSLLEQSTVDEVVWDVAKNCIARLHFVDCVVYQLDRQRNVLVQKAAHGPKNPTGHVILHPIEIPAGVGIVGEVARTGQPEVIGNTALDKRYIADDAVRNSEITVPIWVNGQVWGVLDAEHPQANFFQPQHLKILTTVAALCSQKIKQVEMEEAYRRAERQLMETNRRVAETKLTALRMQMNPHFIFNSLNSINKFILQNDGERASDLLTKFSRLIRQVLINSRAEWVSLRNELNVLQIYLELERLRSDNKFDILFSISDDLNLDMVHVPLLITQPYVENAIWHGLLPMQGGKPQLQIQCRQEKDRLIIDIEDNGIGRAASARLQANSLTAHKTHGIAITEERLNLINEMYGADARITICDRYKAGSTPTGTHVCFTQKLTSF